MVTDLDKETTTGADAIRIYLREISQVPLLSRKQEQELAKRIHRGDLAAREEMITANLRLVVRIAHDYENLGLPLLDLISEGNIGLMHAVENYDPNRGAKVSTYAAWWIRQSIRRALSNQSKTIRLPVHIVARLGKLKRLRHELKNQFGHEPTDAEIAEQFALPAKKIAFLSTLGLPPISLNAPLGDDENSHLGDLIEDESMLNPHQLLRNQTTPNEIRRHVEKLPPREAAILTMRFGIDGQGSRSLETIGKIFNLTRERVRQIQENALIKMRRLLQQTDHQGWELDHSN